MSQPTSSRLPVAVVVCAWIVTQLGAVGCGADRGTDCHELPYDPTGIWTGTLTCDPTSVACLTGPASLDAYHELRFDDCRLVLIDSELAPQIVRSGPVHSLEFALSRPIDPAHLVFQRFDYSNSIDPLSSSVVYDGAEAETAAVRAGFSDVRPPHGNGTWVWSGTTHRVER